VNLLSGDQIKIIFSSDDINQANVRIMILDIWKGD